MTNAVDGAEDLRRSPRSPRPHSPPAIIAADEAPPAYSQIGIIWNVVLPADVTSGEFTMLDQTMPYGTGPPPHVDERYDEGFYILEAPSVARWTPITGS